MDLFVKQFKYHYDNWDKNDTKNKSDTKKEKRN